MWCARCVPEALEGRATRRGTNVWPRGRNQCVNSVVQPSAHSVRGGLRAEGGWKYIDACQKPRVTTGPAKRLAALMGKRDRVTVAVQQDRCVCEVCKCVCVLTAVGVAASVCVCVCACVCI